MTLRTTLISHADIENLLYTDPAAAESAVRLLLGPDATVVIQGDNLTEFTPRTLIAYKQGITLVFISGTTQFQQFALQGFFSLIPPSFQAGYGTNPAWQTVANIISQRIVDSGAPLDNQIRLIGHSFGGAVAILLAAMIKRFSPNRQVEVMTFGAPKTGDQRLTDLLTAIPMVTIANSGDPIPGLPPALPYSIPFGAEILFSILEAWAQYVTNPNQFILDLQGQLTASQGVTFSLAQLGQLIIDALTSTPPSAIEAHSMAEYYTRLLLPP